MFGERVAEARKRAGLAQVDLAIALGKERSTVAHVETNRAGLLAEGLVRAAQALHVSSDYLLGLTDDPSPAADLYRSGEDPEYCALPWNEAFGSAGPGVVVDSENEVRGVVFRRDWLRRSGINPDMASVIEVVGESMEPTICDRALVLLDHQRTTRRANRVFAVRSEDGLQIKRIAKAGGGWLLVSDNPEYGPVPWPREAQVVAQVMWTGRTL